MSLCYCFTFYIDKYKLQSGYMQFFVQVKFVGCNFICLAQYCGSECASGRSFACCFQDIG